jgi:hypothetical protein
MTASMKTASFRFYGSLVDLVTDRDRRRVYSFRGRPSVKDAVEAQGVPHPEVDLILVDGAAVNFRHTLADGERVSVYPYSRQAGTPRGALLPARPDPPRFVCDVHLGRLARSLRMLGLDVRYDTGSDDPALARVSDREDRILLTRDRELLKRSRVTHGAFVRAEDPDRQFAEIVHRFDLQQHADPLSRCLSCNRPLEPVALDRVAGDVPPRVRESFEAFFRCPACDQVFWNGTHVDRMREKIRGVFDGGPPGRSG